MMGIATLHPSYGLVDLRWSDSPTKGAIVAHHKVTISHRLS